MIDLDDYRDLKTFSCFLWLIRQFTGKPVFSNKDNILYKIVVKK